MADKAVAAATHPTLRVVMLPDYRTTNPYQRLIAEGLEALNVRVDFSGSARRIFPLFGAAHEFGVDVVHLHWITPFVRGRFVPVYVLFAMRLLLDIALTRAGGTRIVWTIHNKVSHESRYPKIEMWLRRRIARLVDGRIVHSPDIQREIAALYGLPVTKFDIVPHASFGDLYGQARDMDQAREALGLARTGRVFLNFGLMRPYKGIKRLLDAWAESGIGEHGNTLLLAGDFNDAAFRAEIETAAAPLTGVRIDAGHVADDRVGLYFSASDAVVLPFERILTSGSMHLAISFVKPLVAPRVGSVGEMLESAGRFAYDPADPAGLRNALSTCAIADDSAFAAERSEIERRRASLLDWAGVARKTLAVYERACGRPRGA